MSIIFSRTYYVSYINYVTLHDIIDIIATIHTSLTPCCNVPWLPLAFITYRGTILMPTSWQTTSCIRLLNPLCGRRALPERDCAVGAEWFRCHRQELRAVFPGYFQWGWRRELVSCSQAHIWPGNRLNPTNLKIRKIWYSSYNVYNWYNLWSSHWWW